MKILRWLWRGLTKPRHSSLLKWLSRELNYRMFLLKRRVRGAKMRWGSHVRGNWQFIKDDARRTRVIWSPRFAHVSRFWRVQMAETKTAWKNRKRRWWPRIRLITFYPFELVNRAWNFRERWPSKKAILKAMRKDEKRVKKILDSSETEKVEETEEMEVRGRVITKWLLGSLGVLLLIAGVLVLFGRNSSLSFSNPQVWIPVLVGLLALAAIFIHRYSSSIRESYDRWRKRHSTNKEVAGGEKKKMGWWKPVLAGAAILALIFLIPWDRLGDDRSELTIIVPRASVSVDTFSIFIEPGQMATAIIPPNYDMAGWRDEDVVVKHPTIKDGPDKIWPYENTGNVTTRVYICRWYPISQSVPVECNPPAVKNAVMLEPQAPQIDQNTLLLAHTR